MARPRLRKKEIALDGALKTNVAGTKIKPNDFKTLTNLRYKENGLEAVYGQTRYNGTAITTYIKPYSGIQYSRQWPTVENWNVIGAYDTNGANLRILKNSTMLPSSANWDSTALFTATDTTSAAVPRFSLGPNSSLVMCNGVDSAIWYGQYAPCSGYIDLDILGASYKYDYTTQVSENTTSAFAVIHGHNETVDATEVALLLHLDNNVTDSSGNAITVTPSNLTYDATYYKFGTHSGIFNGTNTSLSCAADSMYNWTTNNKFTFEAYVYRTGTTLPSGTYFSYRVDASNYMNIEYNAGTKKLQVGCTVAAASSAVSSDTIEWVSYPVTYPAWHHIAVVLDYDGAYWQTYFFLDGQLYGQGPLSNGLVNASSVVCYIGADISTGSLADYYSGKMDEVRISNVAQWTTEFTPPTRAYGSSDNVTEIMVAGPLPISGLRWEIATNYENATACNAYVFYWDGERWVSCGAVTRYRSDGTTTISDGKPLSAGGQADGIEIWSLATNSDNLAKLYNYNDTVAYWYKIEMDDCDNTTRVESLQLKHNMQQIKDLWDGTLQPATAFLWYDDSDPSWNDYSTNIFENSYDSYNESTYAKLGGFNFANDALYVGSLERLQGIKFSVQPGFVNTTDCYMTVYYWSGSAWTKLASRDGTKIGTKSFSQSGSVVWDPPDVQNEFVNSLSGVYGRTFGSLSMGSNLVSPIGSGSPIFGPGFSFFGKIPNTLISSSKGMNSPDYPVDLYYYKITFTTLGAGSTLAPSETAAIPQTAGVHVFSVQTIPAQVKCRGYKFPFVHNNSLFLCSNMDSEPNAIIWSEAERPQVFNGPNTGKLRVGDGTPVVAAASFNNLIGNALVRQALLFKRNSTWRLLDEEPYRLVNLSESVGCIAPMTVAVGEIEAVQGLKRKTAIWLSQRGVVYSDGNTISDLSNDINDKFRIGGPNALSNLQTAHGFLDENLNEYHILIPGSSEWVYSFRHQKWFQIERGASARIYGAFFAPDANGNPYYLGWTWDGITYALERGTDFDYGTASSNGINCVLETADLALAENYVTEETVVRGVKFIQEAKSVATTVATIQHFGDTKTTGTTLTSTLTPVKSGYGLKDWMTMYRLGPHIFHRFKITITQAITEAVPCFEPEFLSIVYEHAREDVRQN